MARSTFPRRAEGNVAVRWLSLLVAAASALAVAGADVPGPKEAPPGTGLTAGRVCRLRVVAADTGKPVPKARARVWIAFTDYWTEAD